MEPVRPEFVPDPDLDRESMEALQREIAAAAVFEDDRPFDPAGVSVESSTELTPDDDQARIDGEGLDPAAATEASAPVVVGVDQAFLDDRAISAVVAMRDGAVIERVHAVVPLSIPYVPGLLSFREGGPILAAFEELSADPDLALFDGSGRIHYRQAGLATHLGVVLELPSVGVAKRLLCGTPRGEVDGLEARSRVPIVADDEIDAPAGTVVGYAVQTRQFPDSRRINPLYVSPGHRVGTETGADLALATAADYKLPEPIRLADAHADRVRERLD